MKRKFDAIERLFYLGRCNMYLVMKLKHKIECEQFINFAKANLIQLKLKGVNDEYIEYQDDIDPQLIVYHNDESHPGEYYEIKNLGRIIYVETEFLGQIHVFPKDSMTVTIINHSVADSKFVIGFYNAFYKNEPLLKQIPASPEQLFEKQITEYKEKIMNNAIENAKCMKVDLKNSFELLPQDQTNLKHNYLLSVEKFQIKEYQFLKKRFTQRHILANAIGSMLYYIKTGQISKQQLLQYLQQGIYCKTNYVVDTRQFVNPADLKSNVFGDMVSSCNAVYYIKAENTIFELVNQLTDIINVHKARNEWCRFFPEFNETMAGNPQPLNNFVLNTIQLSQVGRFETADNPAWFGAYNNKEVFPQMHCCITYSNGDNVIIQFCYCGNDEMVQLGEEILLIIKKTLLLMQDDVKIEEIIQQTL